MRLFVAFLSLFLCFLFVYGDGECVMTLSESQCEENGCQVIKGSRCSSQSVPPPCDLTFSTMNGEDCCDLTSDGDHVHYLGCMDVGFICTLQCMEYLPTNSLYIVWEGCAQTSEDWADVSSANACEECFDYICPDQARSSTAGWIVIILTICALVALAIVFVSLVIMGILQIRPYVETFIKRRKKGVNDKELEGGDYAVELYPMADSEVALEDPEEATSGPTTSDQAQNNTGVFRRADGKIEIPMADGSSRVVTEEQYKKLFAIQVAKQKYLERMRQEKQKALHNEKEESKRKVQEAIAVAEEEERIARTTENDALV